MRVLAALVSLPLLAAAPVTVEIRQATVTWGAGIEPQGKRPPSHFEAQVVLTGRKVPNRPVFRVWRVQADRLQSPSPKATKLPPLAGAQRLECDAAAGTAGSWTLGGPWPGPLAASDRLVVEVRSGSRLLGWASTQPLEQLLQSVDKKRTLAPTD